MQAKFVSILKILFAKAGREEQLRQFWARLAIPMKLFVPLCRNTHSTKLPIIQAAGASMRSIAGRIPFFLTMNDKIFDGRSQMGKGATPEAGGVVRGRSRLDGAEA